MDQIEFFNPGALPKSLERIMAEDLSLPRNPILVKLFHVAKLAENTGYGFDKMIQGWQSYSGTAPQLSTDTGFTKSVFQWSIKEVEATERETDDKVGDRVGEKLTDNQQKIVQLMGKDPYISAKKLSESIGISNRKVEENIKKLKDKGIVERVGSAKGGHWSVNLET